MNGLTIEELADEVGLSVRTVRYYITRGLVAGATTRGRGASYDEDHVQRLRLIRRWSERGLSLAEMEQRLADPFIDLAATLLEEDALAQRISSGSAPRSRNPKDLVRSILERSQATVASSSTSPRGGAAEAAPAPPDSPDESNWRRLTLLPGLELHIRNDREKSYRQIIHGIRSLTNPDD